MPFEAFVVLRETVVIAHRSKNSVTFTQPNSFLRISQEVMQFGPRWRAFLIQEGGKFRIADEQPQPAMPMPLPRPHAAQPQPSAVVVASFTTITLPHLLGGKAVAITDDASTRTLLRKTPVTSYSRRQFGGPIDVHGRTTVCVVSEAEFDSFFVKPVGFLTSRPRGLFRAVNLRSSSSTPTHCMSWTARASFTSRQRTT